ncbi:MAG: HlyD family efflux transporter periplasmic adaptor subunit [Pseudomonadota bacterium]
MDRHIDKPKFYQKKALMGTSVAFFIVVVSAIYALSHTEKSLKIKADDLRFSEVKYDNFKNVIPIRVKFEPSKTVYIDAVQGGTVEEINIKQGDVADAGYLLIKLSNVNFQLQVFAQEAAISEQLDINSQIRLQLDQNQYNLKKQLNDIDYAIDRLQRDFSRKEKLLKDKYISVDAIDAIKEELSYQLENKKITKINMEHEENIRKDKIIQLTETADRLQKHLFTIKNSLDHLMVKAPIKGLITDLNVEIGQIIPSGYRIGQINDVHNPILEAEIDEYYSSRVQQGQIATFEFSGKQYKSHIERIFPQVKDGKFIVKLVIEGSTPPEARPGLSTSAELELGASERSLIVDKSGFYQYTAGKWAFVLNKDKTRAHKTLINPGRTNSTYMEILSQLKQGDWVVTSNYANLLDVEELIIKH